MVTDKTLKAIQSIQEQSIQEQPKLRSRDVRDLLTDWREKLTAPLPPEKEPPEKEPRCMNDEKKKDEKKKKDYFELLDEALKKIYESTDRYQTFYPPYQEKKTFMEQLCSTNNPYAFVKTLDLAVEATLRLGGEIEPNEPFPLYYLHRRQLVTACDNRFTVNKQIGRIWA